VHVVNEEHDVTFLTVREVADRWNVSPMTVRRLAKQGVNPLPHFLTLGGVMRFRPEDVHRYEVTHLEKSGVFLKKKSRPACPDFPNLSRIDLWL